MIAQTRAQAIESAAESLFLEHDRRYRGGRSWIGADPAERKCWRVLAALPSWSPRFHIPASEPVA